MELEEIIKLTANSLQAGTDVSQIHDLFKNGGVSEDQIFLIIKAAQYLVEKRIELVLETNSRKPPFGRS